MADPIIGRADLEVMAHTVRAIGRTGAKGCQIGYLDDDVPIDQARWWAAATFQGARATCDDQPSPTAAVLGLYAMLAAGGSCISCGRPVALSSPEGLTLRARMHGGHFETQQTTDSRQARRRLCVRALGLDGWSTCSQNSGGSHAPTASGSRGRQASGRRSHTPTVEEAQP